MSASVATQSPMPDTACPIRRRRKPVALSRAAGPDWPEVPIPSKILRANALPPRKRAILPSIRGGFALVEVVTDSAANLPADLAAELGIRVVPLHLTIGERVFRDGVDIVMQQFYEELKAGREVASTSAPSPGDFLEAFRAVPGS